MFLRQEILFYHKKLFFYVGTTLAQFNVSIKSLNGCWEKHLYLNEPEIKKKSMAKQENQEQKRTERQGKYTELAKMGESN